MISKTTQRFREALSKLPTNIREQAAKAYRLFRANSQHPSLRFKKIHATDPIFSVRITREYRALGVVDDEEVVWFWIGSHADYDRLIKNL